MTNVADGASEVLGFDGSDLELTETLIGDWRVLGAPPRGIEVPDGESPSPVLVVRGNALEARPADDPGNRLCQKRG